MAIESGYRFRNQKREFTSSREALIQQARERVEALGIPLEERPTSAAFFPFRSRQDMYTSHYQAVQSDHDIRHADATMVLVDLMDRYTKLHSTSFDMQNLNRVALLMSAATHDSRRTGDYVETVLYLSRHGKSAANMVESFYPDFFTESTPEIERTLQLVQQIDTYHDIDNRVPFDKRSLELQLFVIADRLELSRLHVSSKLVSRVVAPVIVHNRIHKYEDNTFASYLDIFAPIAGALLLLSKENIAKSGDPRNPDNHFAAVMQAAETLGIVLPKNAPPTRE